MLPEVDTGLRLGRLRVEQAAILGAMVGLAAPCVLRWHVPFNPALIPRNHNVEEALAAAIEGDFSVAMRLIDALATPYDHDRDLPMFSAPGPGGRPYRTFCGT